MWSFGSDLAQTIFDGGLHNAQVEADKAAYDLAVANYRQAVLAALQQVEDSESHQTLTIIIRVVVLRRGGCRISY